jgi:pre-mRNA-processing factor 6
MTHRPKREFYVKVKKYLLRFMNINLFFYLALEHIPNSVRLWKETVNLESSATDARILLSRAVEVIPLSVELWLALARLEVPERAKVVLNKARKAIPTSHEIWIAAGRLLEQEASLPTKTPAERDKELELVNNAIVSGVKDLRRHQVLLTREQWLKEAERCESEGSPRTCEAIVKNTVAMELEDEDMFDTWIGDAESAEARGMVSTSRAILSYALKVYPLRRDLWRKAADLEKTHGTTFVLFLCISLFSLTHLFFSKEKA